MWQIAKTGDGQNVKLHATGKDSNTLESWAAQEDIAETLKTLKEIAAAISATNKTHAAANCLRQLAQGTATLKDVALREACSAFAFDAWLAKWTTREQSTQKSGAANKGAELPAPRSDESDNEATPSARTESGRGFAEDTRTQAAQPKQQALLHRVCSRRHWDLCARPRDETRMGGGERT
ncbi:hypothetical protein ERJ75_001772200 [Trypanosoma vivax]|nr:hypothetical protein ERJ75_001772200 [Trypanosoma vivax]